jgi:hypothetical protein
MLGMLWVAYMHCLIRHAALACAATAAMCCSSWQRPLVLAPAATHHVFDVDECIIAATLLKQCKGVAD